MPPIEEVDLIVLRRDASPLPEPVRLGIEAQAGVRLRVHRVVGAPLPGETNRFATIARARNEGRRLGSARWAMFLDDDVVLGPDCVARLVDGLRRWTAFAALGADFSAAEGGPPRPPVSTPHVAAGATLFRREVLAFLPFRWEPDKCECQCCCDDLRRAGLGIAYLPGAMARHEPGLTKMTAPAPGSAVAAPAGHRPAAGPTKGRVLAAFDRRHLAKFRHAFLATLRASGNDEVVTAVTFGLAPSEARTLALLPGVEVLSLPIDGESAPVRRLRDFPRVLGQWPGETPVAYWDVGDVLFQGPLGPLWDLVRAHPDRLLAVSEPRNAIVNRTVDNWTLTVHDPQARAFAHGLFTRNPFLNSGFAAGTARTMLRYFREAHRLRDSPALAGSQDWGDQTALNLYCHSDPSRWLEIPDGWNYCLYSRRREDYRRLPGGRIVATSRVPVHAVHGNGKSFRQTELSLFAS